MLEPSSVSTISTAFFPSKPGTLSWSTLSSVTYSVGRTSTLVDKSCPSLMNVGPSFKSPSLRRLAFSFRMDEIFSLSFSRRSASSANNTRTKNIQISKVRNHAFDFPLLAHPTSISMASIPYISLLLDFIDARILLPAAFLSATSAGSATGCSAKLGRLVVEGLCSSRSVLFPRGLGRSFLEEGLLSLALIESIFLCVAPFSCSPDSTLDSFRGSSLLVTPFCSSLCTPFCPSLWTPLAFTSITSEDTPSEFTGYGFPFTATSNRLLELASSGVSFVSK
mmetsp:Transcript_31513/g.121989  ORF Transcript_31513/g.121989 Transcript_31513/m.121989 type:complete len:279 (-) Transcript_31513:570-1406(-)